MKVLVGEVERAVAELRKLYSVIFIPGHTYSYITHIKTVLT